MPKKRYTPEEIIQHLRTVELDACQNLGVTEQTYYYRWGKEYGGLRVLRGGSGNSDSVIRGSLASPTPPKGGEPEERGDEENETESWRDV